MAEGAEMSDEPDMVYTYRGAFIPKDEFRRRLIDKAVLDKACAQARQADIGPGTYLKRLLRDDNSSAHSA